MLIGFILILVFTLTLSVGAMMNTETVSVQENRLLEPRPQFTVEGYLSGDYFMQWERYIADHVPSRAWFLNVVQHLEMAASLNGADTVRIKNTSADIGIADENSTTKKQSIFVLSDRVREIFQYDADVTKQYVDAINAYAQILPAEISMYHMLVPMPIAFEETQYQDISDNQQQAIREVYQQVDPRIHVVDVYTLLEQHCTEKLYFRTDHHWTALGARYGAEAFAQAAQVSLPSLEQYQVYTLHDYIGPLGQAHITDSGHCSEEVQYYLYSGQNNNARRYYYEDSDYIDDQRIGSFTAPMIHINFADGVGDYGIFLSGDYPYIVIEGNADNGRVLAIVKDSYGNAFAPWMAESFEQILCIDPRSCHEDLISLLSEYHVTDFLILNYVKAASLPAYCELLDNYISKQ